jgi:hypothetical protein
LFVSGVAWGLCNNIIHIVIVESNPENHRLISVLHTSYALGSFVCPFLFSIMNLFSLGWTMIMLAMSGFSVLVVIGFGKEYKNTYVNEQEKDLSDINFNSSNKKNTYIVYFYILDMSE